MDREKLKRILWIGILIWAGGIVMRHLFPILLPFGIGLLVAFLADPGVKFLEKRLRLPRPVASAAAVSFGYLMITVILWLLGAALYRELTILAKELPDLLTQVSDGWGDLRQKAMELVERLPDSVSPGLKDWTANLFLGGSGILERAASGVFSIAGSVAGVLPGSALTLMTAVISSFMISAQLPRFRQWFARLKGPAWEEKQDKLKGIIVGWLKAQIKLSGVTFLIVTAGYLMLRVEGAVILGAVTAVVDAVPLLGTGTILIPWCLLCFIRGESVRAIGLAGVYVVALMTRQALEPKLLGGQLGVNPLLTLISLYAGFRLWGVGGMILAPVLAVAATHLVEGQNEP